MIIRCIPEPICSMYRRRYGNDRAENIASFGVQQVYLIHWSPVLNWERSTTLRIRWSYLRMCLPFTWQRFLILNGERFGENNRNSGKNTVESGKKTFSAVFFPLLNATWTIGLLNQTGIGCFLNGEKKYKGFINTNQYHENGIFFLESLSQLRFINLPLRLILFYDKAPCPFIIYTAVCKGVFGSGFSHFIKPHFQKIPRCRFCCFREDVRADG